MTKKTTYLLVFPKIFARCLYDQIYKNADSVISEYQTGYSKGYNSQLIEMFEKRRKHLHKRGNAVYYL